MNSQRGLIRLKKMHERENLGLCSERVKHLLIFFKRILKKNARLFHDFYLFIYLK